MSARRAGPRELLVLLGLGVAVATLLVTLPPGRPAAAQAAPPSRPFIAGTIGPGTTDVAFTPEAFSGKDIRGFTLGFDAPAGSSRGGSSSPGGAPLWRCLLEIKGPSTSARFILDVPAGECRISVPCPGLTDFVPSGFRISWLAAKRTLRSVVPLTAAAGQPIPADLGAVLAYLPRHWRRSDYEVFRWTAVPSVLVFDTASYDVQDRLFKRLAFFVEKKGYVGTIVDFEAVSGLHGYNAHDYRAEDLARFFRAAGAASASLLPEEAELQEILLRSGVLKREGERLVAGSGGVVSVSRGSSDALRRRLLVHEALHGLYFTSATFRAASAAAWEATSDRVRDFFLLYLSRPDWSYDLSDAYLRVNEFMAYLLQYSEEDMIEGLLRQGIAGLRERFPERKAWLAEFEKTGAGELLAAYRSVEKQLWAELGARGGGLAALRPER